MSNSRFVYVVFIRTTPEKLWDALRLPEFCKQYWRGTWLDSDWKKGASWKMLNAEGQLCDAGEVAEIDPPKRLVLKWQHELRPELKAEGYTQATFTLEQQGAMMKLTVVHEIDKPNSKIIEAVSNGWPAILSSLKSFLETGRASDWPATPPRA
jgi:uncharacterized protein YndB with AHSA1/START domain